MRSTTSSRSHLSTIKFTVSRIGLLGVLVFSGWAGCQPNSDGLANTAAPSGRPGGANDAAVQSDGSPTPVLDGAMGGAPADAGLVSVSDGPAGGSMAPQSIDTLARDAGSSSLLDARGDTSRTGGVGGQGAGTGGMGGNSMADAGLPPGVDAPQGGTTSGSKTGGNDAASTLSGGKTGGNTGTTGGALGGASGGSPSAPADAGNDVFMGPDTHVPADTAKPDASPWRLLWSDEFDREANTGVVTSKWNVSTWNPGTVNNEEQKYTARAQNVFHDGDGHLVLRGLNEEAGPNPYTSGRIQTDGKYEFKFGRIEIRAKLPAGQGSFPGMVLMGTNGGWPSCGEIGLMEQRGQDKTSVYCSTYSDSQNDLSKKVTFPTTTSLSAEFHTYALEWYVDHMVFFIDDKEEARREFGASSPFATDNNNFYIILDVALGGNMGGAIDDAAFPMDMVLDYVRVYSL